LFFGLPANRKWLVWAIGLGLSEFLLAHLIVDLALLRCLTGVGIGAGVAPFVKQGIEEMWGGYVSV
jgi:hypothetical protein